MNNHYAPNLLVSHDPRRGIFTLTMGYRIVPAIYVIKEAAKRGKLRKKGFN